MPYITRDDGVRFVIPSYRDVISAKKPALLKKEILLLSASHGEYITLQRKNIDQYEVAFSNEPGYLLGETVWNQFKRPQDLIYCEAIPNTSEAILVIVKGTSVYLDGSFPKDSIADELVIFRTQQNNFDIYIYGDVPISKEPEEDKFTLDENSVHSFTVLTEPAFPTLPKIKAFQLQLVDIVLKSQGIGVLPIRNIILFIVAIISVWFAWDYLRTHKKELPVMIVGNVNPYQNYIKALISPDPSQEVRWTANAVSILFTANGWVPMTMSYSGGMLVANMQSFGTHTDILFDWAKRNHALVGVTPTGFTVMMSNQLQNRPEPKVIYSIPEVIASITDELATVIPGNNLTLAKMVSQGKYSQVDLTINFTGITPTTLDLIGQQLKQLPLVLTSISINLLPDGSIGGSIILKVLGN